MNETKQVGTEMSLYFRRLEEPAEIFGRPLGFDPLWWLAITIPLLLLALALVCLLYRKDSKAVGWRWGSFLGFLRTLTYLSLFFIWLLPAVKTEHKVEKRSQAILLADVSGSLQQPEGLTLDSKTRAQMLVEFLTTPYVVPAPEDEGAKDPARPEAGPPKTDFVSELARRNSLLFYRFGDQLDPRDWRFEEGAKDALQFPWDDKLQPTPRPVLARTIPLEVMEELQNTRQRLLTIKGSFRAEWINLEINAEIAKSESDPDKRGALVMLRRQVVTGPQQALTRTAAEHPKEKDHLEQLRVDLGDDPRGAFKKANQRGMLNAPVLEQLERETIDDPLNALGEYEQNYSALPAVRNALTVPIAQNADLRKALEERQKRALDELEANLAEVKQLPERLLSRTNMGGPLLRVVEKHAGNQLQGIVIVSDGKFNSGETGPNSELARALRKAKDANVPVLVIGVAKAKHVDIPNLRIGKIDAQEEVQPEDPFPVAVRVNGVNLPKRQEVKVILTIQKPDGSEPETMTDAKVVMVDATGRNSSGTAQFRITNPKKLVGDWKFTARVEPLPSERTHQDNRSDDVKVVKVDTRKLTVLMFADVQTRDAQFFRTMMVREKDKFELFICLQNYKEGVQLDLPPENVLDDFPNVLRERVKEPDENLRKLRRDSKNIAEYDVIVCFDPDWRKLTPPQRDHLRRWVEDFGGGLITVAGPINTFWVPRDRELRTIHGLYPVDLDDSPNIFDMLDRPSKEAWALNWGPAALQAPFLDLADVEEKDETAGKGKQLEVWEQFFNAARDNEGLAREPSQRGFHGFFPAYKAKPNATIVARFGDGKYTTPTGERQPYFAMQDVKNGKTFYMGSGEIWRLRSFGEKYHERFWTKLVRYTRGKPTRGTLQVVGARYVVGDSVEVHAQVFDVEMKPLKIDPTNKIELKLQVAGPDGVKNALVMEPIPSKEGWFKAAFPARRTGEYKLELAIPNSQEPPLKDAVPIETLDIERDNEAMRANFAALHAMATKVEKGFHLEDETNTKREMFDLALRKGREFVLRQHEDAPAAVKLSDENKDDRLFFVITDEYTTAQWVPECIHSDPKVVTVPGTPKDIWDKGLLRNNDGLDEKDQGLFLNPYDPEHDKGPPWALLLVVTLLSVEWLTRKLLKLA